ncbi:AN1-type zinc finger protein 4-like [Neocloeon triangulifer]|uniref:AN1-type zinc finger protein 4-like n=1 Tax=Neocloeon triangulifer TaxID=2078957 RepID=UPI00286F1E42|nr:AN1-type zinc finger protein 4-like [Neocloeon triangulifer]
MSRSNSRRKPLNYRASRCPGTPGASKHQQIEIIVETLSGTAFEMTASPSETLLSIKSKIQHVEGIPVAHQHLIYNLKELQNDTATLSECGLKNGSKLRLVLSLRGGPISTKRLPVLACSGDDFEQDFEPVPSGSHIVLLTQEGEYLSLLKMVKNDDGSFSPLKEDWPSPDLLMESNSSDFGDDQRLPLIMPALSTDSWEMQNAITKSKIEDLKQKIELLSLKKKLKKLNSQLEAPAETPTATSSDFNHKPLLPPIGPQKLTTPNPDPLTNPSLVKQIHLNHFVLDNRPRTSPETLYVVGHNLNQAVQKEAKDMCRLLGEVRRRQWTKEVTKEPNSLAPPPAKKRCKVCRRRLNITNSHTCRCSGLFCATHRYAETHDCSFDYKADGRKYLSQTNPLVVMPKLPKI